MKVSYHVLHQARMSLQDLNVWLVTTTFFSSDISKAWSLV
jgi:hypothetical protein